MFDPPLSNLGSAENLPMLHTPDLPKLAAVVGIAPGLTFAWLLELRPAETGARPLPHAPASAIVRARKPVCISSTNPRSEGPPMKVRILVSLKPGVLDPQGRAVHHALEGLGFTGVEDVRVGRVIELEVAESTSDEALREMCEKLLANMVIENYRIEKLETA
jgi:phosphoribosylformylglycinamidine synthase